MNKHRSRANVPGESEENSEHPFSNHNARNAGAVGAGRIAAMTTNRRGIERLIALMLCRSWVAVGGEFAIPDGVFALLVAIVHRAHGAVGLHCESILAGLLKLREEDAQIQHAIARNLGGDHFAFIGGGAEVAPVHDPAARRYLI